MSFSSRYLPAVTLAVLSLTVSLFAQTTTKQTSKAPRGSVSGRVTIKDKGAAGVAIGLHKSEDFSRLEPWVRAKTDQDGYYRITNVAPGSYDVLTSAPGFITTKNVWAESVIVGEDENVEGINFALVRGGVITGRVTDADGRPVIEQQINIYPVEAGDQRAQQPQAQLRYVPSHTAQTDDRGIYRVFGLRAGPYKVAVGRSDEYSTPFSTTHASYRQVFHPDVTDPAKATIVEVSEGSEANNVDISAGRPLQTFSVSGRVIDAEKGQPVVNIRFGFQRTVNQRVEFVNVPATPNAAGEFAVEGLIPGKYGVVVYPNQNSELRAEPLSFDIVDQDVSNLTVRLTKGASLSGVVVVESEDKTASERISQFQLRAFVMGPNGGGIGNSATSPIGADGSFRFAGLPGGTVNILLAAKAGPLPPKGFSISRIERDGVVAAERGLEIKEGEQVTGMRIVLGYGNAILRGVVKVENGTLREGSRIFVRVAKVGEHMGLRPPPVDSRGQFLMEGLAPGLYEVIASVANDTGPPRINSRREVNVQEGVVTDVVLTLDLSTRPQP